MYTVNIYKVQHTTDFACIDAGVELGLSQWGLNIDLDIRK
jgi:hypothetical protein